MKQLHNDLVDAGKGLKKCYFSGYKVKAIDPNELHKAVDKLDFAVTQVLNAVKESIKCPNFTKDASTPSSSNTLAYADYILNSMEGTAKTGEAQNASSGGVESAEKPTIEDLKKALENAKKQLVDAQKELGKAMTELKAAKDSLPIKVAQTAGVKVAIDNEIQRLVKEAKEIDNKVLEFDGLAEKHPEAKALIDGCRNSLNDQLNKINKEWEKAGFKTAAAEVGEKEAKKQVSDAKDKVAQAKGEIGDTKYKISSLSKELKDLLAEAKKGTVNNITPMYKEA
jgi:chromosome segregation ATPase